MIEPRTDSFEEWWDKLNNAMEKDSMAAWMIYADLPKGIAHQLWHDSLKHHKKEIKDAEKDIETLTKALDEIIGFHDHVPADYKNGNTGPEGYPDEGEVLAHEFLVKWTESTRKALKEINEN